MRELTTKQEKFVSGLIKGLSQREAYKQAGYSYKNMTDKTIDERACVLFKKDKVKTRFNGINDKVVKKAEKKTIASAIEVMEYMTNVLRGKETNTVITSNEMGEREFLEIKAEIKDRNKAAEMLAKRYGIDKPKDDTEKEELIVKWE